MRHAVIAALVLKTCVVKEAGHVCGDPAIARNLCQKHYQQDRRGRLGDTKDVAPPGEGTEITIRCRRSLKAEVAKAAAKEGRDASELWREGVALLLRVRAAKAARK